jgi:tape measure domain-containing protein|nr:MAG TPA: tail tape measure [Caudoviricetes sp.]
MAGYVDEKVAKVTLDNKGFSKNADDTISALERMKRAFSKVNGKDATNNIASDMSEMNNTISNATQKSEGLLSRLKGIFNRSAQGIDMSGAGQSIDRMNTDIASKTATTSSILSRLKGIFQKADNHQGFPNSIKSIDGLNSKVSGFDASPLSNAFSKAASSVQNSLSIMDIALGNVLGGMIQKAMSFTGQFFRGYGDGLNEYKNKLGSIQTIMTNTEWEIPDSSVRMRKVSGALEQLNDYADKTIYSFADMTKNIGTFTAAGVSLEKSTTAIKGISNLAAASGSDTNQASMAMYQLSQALASGRVALQDWNSVVNAGMGGKLFQDRLTQTAEKMGHARDMTKSFRDSLKDGWLTSEVLLETLREFSEDQSMLDAATKVKSFGQLVDTVQEAIGSGWATTWEYFLGGFEEAKDLWTSIGDIVNPFVSDDQGTYYDSVLEIERSLGNYRNAMLKTWKDMGGQEALFNTIKNSFEIVFGAMTKFREGFRSVVGDYKQAATVFFGFTKALESVTNNIKNNTYLFTTINAIGKMVGQTFLTLGWIFSKVGQGIASVGKSSGSVLMPLRTAADSIARFMEALRSNTNAHLVFYHIGKTIANVFNIIITVGRIVIFVIKDILKGFSKFGESKGLVTVATTLSDVTGKLLTFVKAIEKFVLSSNKFEQIGGTIGKVLSAIGNAFSGVFSKLKMLANPFGNAEAIFSGAANIFNKLGSGLANIINNIGSVMSRAWDSLVSGVKASYDALKDAFVSFDVASIIKALIGLFAFDKWLKFKNSKGSIVDLVFDKFKEMFGDGKEKATGLLDEVKGVFTSLQGTINSFAQGVQVSSLLMIAVALGILALSIDRLSKIDMKDLSKGMIALGVAMQGLMRIMKIVTAAQNIPKGAATTMIGFAIALRIMASAMIALSKIDSDKMDEAVGSILVLITAMVKVMQKMEKIKNTETSMGKLIAFAISLRILVWSVKALAKLEPEKLAQSMTGVLVLMYALVKVSKSMQDINVSPKSMGAMIIFATSLRLLVWSVKALAKLDMIQMAASVVAVAVLLKALSSAANSVSEVKVKFSAMMALISFALSARILVNAVAVLADLDIDRMAASAGMLGILLVVLSEATVNLKNTKVDISALFSLITFAGTAYILAKSIEVLTNLPLKEMIVSVGVVEVLIASLVAAARVVSNAKVNMSAGLSLIGIGASIYLIVQSMLPLAVMPLTSIVKSLGTVALIAAGLIGVSYIMNSVKMNPGAIASVIVLTTSLMVIAMSLMQLSTVNWASLAAAGGAIAAVMLSLGGTVKIMAGSADSFQEVVGIKTVFDSFGNLLYYIGTTLTTVGALSWQQIGTALVAVTVTIGIMTGIVKLISKMSIDTSAIAALASMAAVLNTAGTALATVAAHPWQQILASMAAVSGVLLAVAGVGVILSKFGSIGGAAQLILLGAGLMALAVPIMLLSTLNLVAVGVALVALAGNLAILLAAGALANLVSGGLAILAGTLISFGVSAILAAASVLIAGLGFLAFVMAIKELVAIAPAAFKTIVDSFVTLVTSLAANSPLIVASFVKMGLEMINGARQLIPEFIRLGFDLLIALIAGIRDKMPELIKTTVEMLVEMGRSFIENIDILLQVAVELATKFIQGLANALNNVKGDLIPAITELFQVIAEIFTALIKGFIGPVLNAIAEVLTPVRDFIITWVQAIGPIIQPFFEALMSTLKALFESLPGIIQPLAEAIIATVTAIADVIRSLADTIIAIVGGIETVVNGIVEIFRIVGETIKSWIQGVVDVINGIANVITATGDSIRYVLEGVDNIFVSFGNNVKTTLEGVKTVVESVGNAIKTALEGVGQIFESIGSAIRNALDGVADIIRAVGDAAKSFGEGFKLFGEGVKLVGEHAATAASGLGSLTAEIAKLGGASWWGNLQGFTEDIEKLATATTNLGQSAPSMMTITVAFAQMSTSLSTMAASVPTVTTSFDSLSTSLSTISGTITPVSSAFIALVTPIQQLQSSLTVVATAFMVFATQITMVGTSLQSVTMAFTNIQNAITILGTSVGSLPIVFDMLGTSILNVQTLLSTFTTSLTTSATGFQQLGEAAMVGMMAMNTSVIAGMATVQATMMASIAALSVAVSVGFTQVSASVTMSMTMVNATVAQSMQGVMSVIQVSMSGVAAQMAASLSQVMVTVTSTMAQLSASIMSSMTSVNATISSTTAQMNATFTQFSSTAQSIVTSLMSTLNSTFQSGMASVVSTVSSGMSSVVSTVSSYSGSANSAGYSVGYQISAGVASGMNANMWSIESAANRIIAKAREAARAAADIHSPSRLFAKDVGKFIPQGIAKGIDNEMPKTVTQMSKTFSNGFDEVASNAVKQGENMANAVSTAVNSIGDMLDVAVDDMNYSPTITPVVDMSNLNKVNMSDYSLDYKGRIASPTPVYGVPQPANTSTVVNTDNSTKEYSINVTVDNGGAPVNPKQLAMQVQEHIKAFDNQNRRAKGEEVFW